MTFYPNKILIHQRVLKILNKMKKKLNLNHLNKFQDHHHKKSVKIMKISD